MKFILICCIVQLLLNHIDTQTPATNYDAYGIRFTANDFLIVEAQYSNTNTAIFAIQFYNLCPDLSCTAELNDSSMYIYSVSIGMKQTVQEQYFAFNGQMNDPNTGALVAFIGMAQNQILNNCSFTLNYTILQDVQYNFGDYYAMTVDPQGRIAYGFAFQFLVLFDLTTQDVVAWQSEFSNSSYTSSLGLQRFMPQAVAATNTYVILVGVVDNTNLGRWVPIVYLIDVRNCSFNLNSTCMPSWSQWPEWTYAWSVSNWEMYTSNADYGYIYDGNNVYDENNDAYQAIYYLSTDINPNTNEVLFGIQYFNTVVRLSVDTVNFSRLIYIDQLAKDMSTGIGFGKSVKYANDSSIVILANTFSFDYSTWYSSSIQIYYGNENFSANTNVIPAYIFPNVHQPLWTPPMQGEFLAIQMTSAALMFMDVNGNVYVLLYSPPGSYSDTSSGTGQNQIYFSNPLPCEPGTYSSNTSIEWCHLCPTGTFNPGNMTTQCTPCSNATSFCPLGSVSDTPLSFMSRRTQIRAYPESPDNTIFDDILILNMFSLNASERRCLLLSPLFWALAAFALALFIVILMGLLKFSLKCRTIRVVLKKIFRLTDLIGEGELWIGGLASFSIIILCIFAYSFSNSYLYQYPIETVGNSSFACDQSLRNAKFDSSLQLLVTADTSAVEQQELFKFMDQQMFTLHVQFINTQFQCNELEILEIIALTTANVASQCSFDSDNGILSIHISLTAQLLTIQYIISNDLPTGGLSIGLTGAGTSSEDNHIIIQELNFQESFGINNQILTQNPTFEIQLVKVVNSTKSLQSSSSDEKYSGLFIPVFNYDLNQVFSSKDSFEKYSSSSQTVLQIQITSLPYYIRNIQQPIARQSEIIFHNLLFTIVCMEIFGLVFLVSKLMLLPLFQYLLDKWQRKSNLIGISNDNHAEDETEMRKRIDAYLKKLEEKDENHRSKSKTISSTSTNEPRQINQQSTNMMPPQWMRRFGGHADSGNNNRHSRAQFGRSVWD